MCLLICDQKNWDIAALTSWLALLMTTPALHHLPDGYTTRVHQPYTTCQLAILNEHTSPVPPASWIYSTGIPTLYHLPAGPTTRSHQPCTTCQLALLNELTSPAPPASWPSQRSTPELHHLPAGPAKRAHQHCTTCQLT